MEDKTDRATELILWIREELQSRVDKKYREFHQSLVPGLSSMLGVRVPDMREIAKKRQKRTTMAM